MSKDLWLNANKETAGDLILTGYTGQLRDMPVYDEVSSLFGNGEYALDFGCGVGRNSVALSENYSKVVAFDLPSMISLVPEDNKLSNIIYTTNWEYVKSFKFNMVLASLVFQHIDDAELESYLNDLSQMRYAFLKSIMCGRCDEEYLNTYSVYVGIINAMEAGEWERAVEFYDKLKGICTEQNCNQCGC